jgi:DNA-binding LacI/PurR family transcriptional regulator
MRVKLRDVAARANVSIQTVSNVVNGKHAHVSDTTRQRVVAAIDALGYQPNAAARNLRRARVGIIALAIPDLANPYYSEIGAAIVAEAALQSYTVLLDDTRFERTSESLTVGGLLPHAIDGVILEPHSIRLEDLDPRRHTVPIVLLGEDLLDAPHDRVAIDSVAAARLATRHLLDLGRRRIAAIGIDPRKTQGAAVLRLEGFMVALTEAGRSVDPRLLVRGGHWHRQDGAQAMRALLSLDDPPDAVFCFNDLLALGAMWAAQEAGYRVPDDIAVAGVDDIEDGRFATPSLTSVGPDKAGLGHLAVSLLMGRMAGQRAGPPEWIRLPVQLHVRTSTIGTNGKYVVPHGTDIIGSAAARLQTGVVHETGPDPAPA